MINKALILLREELNAYFLSVGAPPNEVTLGNVGFLQTEDGTDLKNKLIITIYNAEQESSLKNETNTRRVLNGLEYRNTPIHLNLYLLFSAYYNDGSSNSGADADYLRAWERLSYVIQFFQEKNHFTLRNSSSFVNSNSGLEALSDPDYLDMKLILDMCALSFEQINHLWASLGGRQLPSVMYKARLVKVQSRELGREAPVIEEVQNNIVPISR